MLKKLSSLLLAATLVFVFPVAACASHCHHQKRCHSWAAPVTPPYYSQSHCAPSEVETAFNQICPRDCLDTAAVCHSIGGIKAQHCRVNGAAPATGRHCPHTPACRSTNSCLALCPYGEASCRP